MDIIGSTLTPVILSASRETDIPAFYSGWLVSRLREGWCEWKNTYSGTIHKVSFDKTRVIVFWSKNPKPLLERLDEMEALGFRQYYFQFTLNDYVREGLEPNVPPVAERIDTFKRLADRIGKERVIWRFDPLMLGCAAGMKPGPPACGLSIDELLERIGNIGRQLKGYTEKLVFSFIDIGAYRKVQRNLEGLGVREFSPDEQRQFAKGLAELNKEFGLELATCGEEADLSAYGVRHNKCVDDELMMRLFHDDAALMDFIGAEYVKPTDQDKQMTLSLGFDDAEPETIISGWHIPKSKKDKGQRKACGCIVSKDIGAYNTCPHLCRYCYANAQDAQVLANYARHCQYPLSPLLVPED
jgi:hypothetical protein